MMNNLFSSFDPTTNMMLSLNWISTSLGLFMMPLKFWTLPNRIMLIMKTIMTKLHLEFKMLLKSESKGLSLMMITIFMFILTNNVMGLLPYIFTSSSHLIYTLSLALPLWLACMTFGWLNNTKHMLAHMVPLGTPTLLTPFMVMIETISNIIRPSSLAVRLTANMIAGHLLMSLLGNNSTSSSTLALTIIMMIQVMLMMFEMAVSLIQAYVFSVLSTLYSSEV
uniref:ATP synthase F0 subunit 6 n=1 Tax=Urochelellus acutihumeralis TaxID=3020186 RepID=UPI0024114AA8|nr:ATP synthase F0 subunit 6 [Urochelellus acutihumeralis]WEM32430.1 ATP synthase F0 subunit 6 [Urochelellus acutihumeralis]